jgi:thiamine biosynthesis lipoprotein ApbE
VLGTSLELRVYAETQGAARQAETAVLTEIDRLEAVFSNFSATSELSRWQRTLGTPESLSSELLEVLTVAEQWREITGNAFHPGSEELTQLWKRSAEAGREPTAVELRAALDRLDQPFWRIDQEAGVATRLAECTITLNAIAKGYIVDRACERALATESVQRVLLNVGGDLRVAGHDDADGELIGIADPRQDAENAPLAAQVRVRNGAVASSGSARRGLWIGDRWYSHVFDPRTGQPVEQIPGASVLAPTAMDADVLATAISVLTPNESLALADSLPQVACILMTDDGTVHRSQRWVELELSSAT